MNSTFRLASTVVLAALLAGASAPAAAGAPGAQPQTEKFSKTVPLPKGGALDLRNFSGDVAITGGAGDQVVVDAVKRGKTAEDLKLVQIEVTSSASRVEVRTQYPRESRNVSVSVDFTVTVPRGAGVTVRTFSGSLKLAAIDGPLTAETISGDVVVTAAGQLESAKSTSGDVRVESASSEGDVSVSSTSGDVALKAVRARGIDANSVSGSVHLADVTCMRAKATSVTGEIVFGGSLAKGGRYSLQSHSGDVTVYTDGKSGFEVAAGTFSGEISSDLTIVSTFGGEPPQGAPPRGAPPKGEPPPGEPGPGRGPRPKRGGPGQRVRGTFGDGGAFLELSAFSGDVKIVSKMAGTAVKK